MSRYASAYCRLAVSMLLRLSLLALLPASLLPVLAACAAAPVTPSADAAVVAAIIVKPRSAAAAEQVIPAVQQRLGRDAGVRYGRAMAGNAHVVYLTEPARKEQIPALIERLRASGAFEYVELDSMMKIQ